MDPINYSIDVQAPFQAALQGYQAGAAVRNDQAQQQQQQAALAQQQAQQQLLNDLAQKQRNGTATADDFSSVMTQIPSVAEHLSKAWSVRNPAQQQAHASDLLEWGAAIKSGQPQIAVDAMMARADQMERQAGGVTQDSQALRDNAKVMQAHPEFALGKIQAMLAANPNGKGAADALASFGGEQRAQQLQPSTLAKSQADATTATVGAANAPTAADLSNKNMISQINERAARLGLDRDRLTSDTEQKVMEMNQKFGELPDDARKLVNDSSIESTTQAQSAARLNELADRIDQANTGHGLLGKTADVWNRAFGTENGTTALKQEMARQINNTAIGNIRAQLGGGGRFTDTDMKVALGNVPDPNSDPSLISSYFRGMAKLQTLGAAQQDAQAEWAGQVRHLGRAPRDIEVDGVQVPKGTSFNDFAKSYLARKAQELDDASLLASRGYMKHAAGPAAVASAPPQVIPGALGSGTYVPPGAQ